MEIGSLEGWQIDATDDLALFAKEFSQWLNEDGYPRSWAHFQIALRTLVAENARAKLRFYDAAVMAWCGDKAVRERWLDKVMAAARQ